VTIMVVRVGIDGYAHRLAELTAKVARSLER
jgi:hypothetical protein